MKNTHTPGNWHINDTEAHGEACAYAACIVGPESVGAPCVASLEFGGTIETDSATTKANARLIAAAPHLLASLQRALAVDMPNVKWTRAEIARSRQAWRDDAKAAILSATQTPAPAGK